MAYIIFKEEDLMDFFESDCILIGEENAGEFICSYKNNNRVDINLFISVYELKCEITLSKKDHIFINLKLDKVEFIEVGDNLLTFFITDKKPIILKKFYSPNLDICI